MKKINNFDLSKHSTIGIGPIVKNLYIIENIDDLKNIDNYKIIGNSSNILFKKKQYNNNFILLGEKFKSWEIMDHKNLIIKVGAGININNFINQLAENNLSCIEFLYGIPATIGGLVKMNAGAFSHTIFDALIGVHTEKGYIAKKDIEYSYRYTNIKDIILFVELKCKKMSKYNINEKINTYINKRKETQPISMKSLGSVFKNPANNTFAGELIEKIGYKGKCIGDICVSQKHANFIINKGNGNSNDFLELSENIITKIKNTYNINMEYEIEIF